MTRSSAAVWKAIPAWYVIGTADRIITAESETFMAHRAHARIGPVAGGSHLTLISHPGAVTDQILAAAQAACASSLRAGMLDVTLWRVATIATTAKPRRYGEHGGRTETKRLIGQIEPHLPIF